MTKRILALITLVLVFAMSLSACGCAHETWTDADCLNPKTCADCGETEGEALGHNWKDADCVTAKTCQRCATTEGAAKGHDWKDATCAAPKTCASCGLTEGQTLEHTWVDATTEAPKTCTACGATEGERIVTDPRFTTANTLGLYGTWVSDIEMPAEAFNLEGFTTPMEVQVTIILTNDGHMTLSMAITNADVLAADLMDYMEKALYASLEAEMTKEEVDAYMEDNMGMSVKEYAAMVVDAMNLPHLLDAATGTIVYFTEDGNFYTGYDWDSTMDCNSYTLDGDTLTIGEDILGVGQEETVFTRVTE